MASDKIFIMDDTLSNQDWIKSRSFDFPFGSRQSLEATFGLNVPPKQRIARLREIALWPTMQNAPEWLKDEIDAAMSSETKKRTNTGKRTVAKPSNDVRGQ